MIFKFILSFLNKMSEEKDSKENNKSGESYDELEILKLIKKDGYDVRMYSIFSSDDCPDVSFYNIATVNMLLKRLKTMLDIRQSVNGYYDTYENELRWDMSVIFSNKDSYRITIIFENKQSDSVLIDFLKTMFEVDEEEEHFKR